MPTCRDIVKSALRKCAVLGMGRDPGPSQASAALQALQGMYDGWVDGGAFGRLAEVVATGDYTAREQDRVLNDGHTITYPDTIDDASMVNGNIWGDPGITPRPPYDLAMIQVVENGAARECKVYDAYTAAWTSLLSLTLDDEAPLGTRDADGLASSLAARLAAEYGAELSPLTLAAAGRFESRLGRKASAPNRPVAHEYF